MNRWKDEAPQSSIKRHNTHGYVRHVGVDEDNPELQYSSPSVFVPSEHA